MAMVTPALRVEAPLVLNIELVKIWLCRWPRPQPADAPRISATLSPDGVLDFTQLQERGTRRGKDSVASAWWAELNARLHDRQPVSPQATDVMQRCAGSPTLTPLLAQLFWVLSERLEKVFGDQSKGIEKKATPQPMTLRWQDRAAAFENNLDAHLAEYTLSAVQCASGCKYLTFATDKSSVNGLPLQNSVVVTSSGIGIVCVPQVPLWQILRAPKGGGGGHKNAAAGSLKRKYPQVGVVIKILGPSARGFYDHPLPGTPF